MHLNVKFKKKLSGRLCVTRHSAEPTHIPEYIV
jgi:hypothetical protein